MTNLKTSTVGLLLVKVQNNVNTGKFASTTLSTVVAIVYHRCACVSMWQSVEPAGQG